MSSLACPQASAQRRSAGASWFRPLGVFALGLALSAQAWAVDPPPPREARQRVVTTSRLVKVFFDLEWDLIDARRARNSATVSSLLAEDFEQRLGTQPASPVPREAWMAESLPSGSLLITEMAVRDHNDLLIVSFKLSGQGAGAAKFVVDVWRKNGDAGYLLATRYLSDAEASAKATSSVPAVAPASASVPTKR
jgi:hypothetical protein